MAHEETSTGKIARSGLLIDVKPVIVAVDRHVANGGAVDNTDGNDPND
jgi:hypothetical protein